MTIPLQEALPETPSWAGPRRQHSPGTAEPRAEAHLRGSTGIPRRAFNGDASERWHFCTYCVLGPVGAGAHMSAPRIYPAA